MSLPMHVRGPPSSYYICLAIASYLCLRWAFIGINSSLIRPHYELPIAMVASSRKKRSRHGITIRKNKQSVSTAEGSSSHLNRTERALRVSVYDTMTMICLIPCTSMIPCFPASNGTDAHHCDSISNRSSPSHFTTVVLLIFPKSEPGQLLVQKIYTTTWVIKKDNIWEIVIRGNAHATVHLRTINQFLKLVHLRK